MKKKKRIRLPSFHKMIYGLLVSLLFFGFVWVSDHFPTEASARPLHAEHPTELYANQINDDLRQIYVASIREAKESIFLIIYSLSDAQVIKALRQQADSE